MTNNTAEKAAMNLVSDEFVGRSPVTKCIQMKLTPVPETKAAIREQHIIEADKRRSESVKKLNPVIDLFIKKSIAGIDKLDVEWEAYYQDLAKLKEARMQSHSKKDINAKQKAVNKRQKDIAEKIRKALLDSTPDCIEKMSDIKKRPLLDALHEFVLKNSISSTGLEKEEAIEDIENSTLSELGKFLVSRTTILDTHVPDRVLENFEIYADNMLKFRKLVGSGVGEKFLQDNAELLNYLTPSGYAKCIGPAGIDEYNLIISGINDEKEVVKKGYNAFANEYNNSPDRTTRLQKAKKLNKQILFETKKQFVIDRISEDSEVRELLACVDESVPEIERMTLNLIKGIENKEIYVTGSCLHGLSNIVWHDHKIIPSIVYKKKADQLDLLYQDRNKKKTSLKKYNSAIEKIDKEILDSMFPLSEIAELCESEGYEGQTASVYEALMGYVTDYIANITCKIAEVDAAEVKKDGKAIYGNESAFVPIKNYITSVLQIRQLLNLFCIPENNDDPDDIMESIDAIKSSLSTTVKANNLIRSYITKKSKDKARTKTVPLLFGSPVKSKSCWWNDSDAMKISKKDFVLLKKDEKYYILTVFGSYHKNPVLVPAKDGDDYYEAFSYNKGAESSQFIPGQTYAKEEIIKYFEDNPDSDGYEITKNVTSPIVLPRKIYEYAIERGYSSTKSDSEGFQEQLTEYLNWAYEYASRYTGYSCFDLSLPKSIENYTSKEIFFNDLSACLFRKRWMRITKDSVDILVKNGYAGLFLVDNYNMYNHETRRPERGYTKMFLSLFTDENMENDYLSLNALPEISYRSAIYRPKVTHEVGTTLVNRYSADGERIPEHLYRELFHFINGNIPELSPEAEQWFSRIVIRDCTMPLSKYRRYESDTYRLTLTFTANKFNNDEARLEKSEILPMLNSCIDAAVGYQPNILAVSRGTEELLHVVVIDSNGKMLEESDLTTLNGINYAKLLSAMTRENKSLQKDWVSKTKIEDIKTDYMHRAISEITKLALKYNSLIVTESVDEKFRQKMVMIENQLFSKFGAMLKSKLQSLTIPGAEGAETGSVLRPIQLSTPAIDMAKRNGIYYEINAAYTSGVCPYTGFKSLFKFYDMDRISSKREFFSKFDSIRYVDGPDGLGSVEFAFDYSRFDLKVKELPEKTDWTVKVHGAITVYDREIRAYRLIPNAAIYIKDAVESGNGTTEKDLVPQIESLSTTAINSIYTAFTATLGCVVRSAETNKASYWKSPVLDEIYPGDTNASVRARMLAKKARYLLNGGKPEEWLDFIQIAD